MKLLEYLKAFCALTVLATVYNTHFDLLRIPRIEDVQLALSLLCVLLFLTGLYHDHLSAQLMDRTRQEDHKAFPFTSRANQDILFREGLLSFLLFIPVVPALLRFPEKPYLGLSLLLFPLHGLVRAFRIARAKGMELIVGSEHFAFPLRSTHAIRYRDIEKVLIKYEHLYIVLKDDRVETLPLDFFAEHRTDALGTLGDRLYANGIKGSEAVQELAASGNRRV